MAVTSIPSSFFSSSDVSSPQLNSDTLSSSPSSIPQSKGIRLQQSLLILINLHLLRRLFKSSLEVNPRERFPSFFSLEVELSSFFEIVGYVSHHFFESSLLSIKVFFQINTLPVVSEELPQLCSIASFFGAEVQSVFLYVDGNFQVDEFRKYAHLISGLRFNFQSDNDLEFLNKSSFFFPNLKQFHVRSHRFISMALIELLKVNTTVTNLNLNGNRIGDEGARALAEVLKVNNTITSVDLGGNRIGDEGARALAEVLKVNNTITSVYLGANSISAEGVRALVEMLKVNTSVTGVNLGGNSIRAEGARVLAEVLKVNTSVTSIDLRVNSVGDEGARALAEMLKVNTTVTSVNLGGNSIRAEGARALAEMLKVNNTITSIHLWNNSIGAEGTRALAEALKVNTTVTTFLETQTCTVLVTKKIIWQFV
ncbi:hypothetical protein GEMRC1_009835 [Eukaryota sp. GEM-RC1]